MAAEEGWVWLCTAVDVLLFPDAALALDGTDAVSTGILLLLAAADA